MAHKIIHFDARRLDTVWHEVEPLLVPALEKGEGEICVQQVRLLLVQRAAELLLVMDGDAIVGVGVVEFLRYPNYTIGSFIATGGKGMFLTTEDVEQVRHWLQSMGASKMQGFCPDSVARLWTRRGARKAYNVMRWDL